MSTHMPVTLTQTFSLPTFALPAVGGPYIWESAGRLFPKTRLCRSSSDANEESDTCVIGGTHDLAPNDTLSRHSVSVLRHP